MGEQRAAAAGKPVRDGKDEWKFTRHDLGLLLKRIDAHQSLPTAA